MTTTPISMRAADAGQVLERFIPDAQTPMTAADAAARSGLALRDATAGLHWLTDRYRGHLRVTADGDLIFVFPNGFTRPWIVQDRVSRAFERSANVLKGVGRFVVRAWLLLIMVGYVAAFAAVLIGLMLARSEGSDRDAPSGATTIFLVLLRSLSDALFWTFHPWSPLAVSHRYGLVDADQTETDERPFYEKINRFVFGPDEPTHDPREIERRIVAQIRTGKGRIGLADVMRVTGLPRSEADPMMARLMVDYDGDVSVSEEGGICYTFESLRKTASISPTQRPRAVWDEAPTHTNGEGNTLATNLLIGALNVFNLLMSVVALGAGLTLSNVRMLFEPPGWYGCGFGSCSARVFLGDFCASCNQNHTATVARCTCSARTRTAFDGACGSPRNTTFKNSFFRCTYCCMVEGDKNNPRSQRHPACCA
jgi:hypothetical protein